MAEATPMKPAQRHEFFRRLQEINPRPKSDLEYGTPFELLVAVILSAQATDKSVNIATRKLFPVANTPQKILKLGEEKLTPYIQTIGLYRNKAKNVIATCRQLIECHDGEVPATREELQALPGVGRKTANVVLNIAFGEPTMAVDTHIFRISNRIGLAPGKAGEQAVDHQQFRRTQQVADEAHGPALGAVEVHRPFSTQCSDAVWGQAAEPERGFEFRFPVARIGGVSVIAQGQREILGHRQRAEQATSTRQHPHPGTGLERRHDRMRGGGVADHQAVAAALVERQRQARRIAVRHDEAAAFHPGGEGGGHLSA